MSVAPLSACARIRMAANYRAGINLPCTCIVLAMRANQLSFCTSEPENQRPGL